MIFRIAGSVLLATAAFADAQIVTAPLTPSPFVTPTVVNAPAATSAAVIPAGPTTQPALELTQPRNIPGVGNFGQVSPALFRGEQPTAEGFRELKKLGVKTVVSLRTFHSDRDLLKGTGLQYARITAQAWHPEEEDLVAFLKIVNDPANQPVFVHCQHGADRTGYMVASYRIIEQHWTTSDALAELDRFNFHHIWTSVPSTIKTLDEKAVLADVKKADKPVIEVVE